MAKQRTGKSEKHDFDDLRLKCLHYLYANRHTHGQRTMSRVMKEFDLRHSASFNKMMYYLIGAGYVGEEQVGITWLFSLTDKGVLYLEQLKHS